MCALQANKPSVVHITAMREMPGGPLGLNPMQIPQGNGSGFVWDDQGHIITNYVWALYSNVGRTVCPVTVMMLLVQWRNSNDTLGVVLSIGAVLVALVRMVHTCTVSSAFPRPISIQHRRH
jgi:hypothetical protein